MKKFAIVCLLIVAITVSTAGCSLTPVTKFISNTGDTIAVAVDEGYMLTDSSDVIVSTDADTVFKGTWYPAEYFTENKQAVEATPEIMTLLDSGKYNGNPYFLYTDGDTMNYIVRIGDSDTTLNLTSTNTEAEVREAFTHMNISFAA